MKKQIIIVVITLILVGTGLCGCNEKSSSGNNNDNTGFLNAIEVFQDIDMSFEECTIKNYKSFKEGDVLTIRDKINEIKYVDYKVPPYTEVTFAVSELIGLSFRFEGDISGEYDIDDIVQVSFHIKHVSFTIYDETLKTDFCYDLELPEEGFNQEYCEETREVIMPQTSITQS